MFFDLVDPQAQPWLFVAYSYVFYDFSSSILFPHNVKCVF